VARSAPPRLRRRRQRRPFIAPRRYSYRLSLWTFLAPAALILAVIAAVGVVRQTFDSAAKQPPAVTTTAAESTAATSTAATSTRAAAAKKKFHRVKSGETLSAIASRYDTTVEALQELNPKVDPQALQPGTRLRVS